MEALRVSIMGNGPYDAVEQLDVGPMMWGALEVMLTTLQPVGGKLFAVFGALLVMELVMRWLEHAIFGPDTAGLEAIAAKDAMRERREELRIRRLADPYYGRSEWERQRAEFRWSDPYNRDPEDD
jgi:hypothetical protein